MKNNIDDFFWLKNEFNKIIKFYQSGYAHHSILIHSESNNDKKILCYSIICWLMCSGKKNNQICKNCNNCKLMKFGNHPDYYKIEVEKGYKNIGIDKIRSIIKKNYNYPYQDGLKIIWLFDTELLTEQASNAILKTLEEPKNNTYFLLCCKNPNNILPTLKSRCLYWLISNPPEESCINWLKKIVNYDNSIIITALRLCNNDPLKTKMLLNSKNWENRLELYSSINFSIIHKNFFHLLPVLKSKKNGQMLYWFLTLIIDTLKIKFDKNNKKLITNIDQLTLINNLSNRWTYNQLYKYCKEWINCYYHYCNSKINNDLLIVYYLSKLL